MPDATQDVAAAARPPLDPSTARSNRDRSLLVGVAWTAGVKWGAQILAWACTLIIARLLSPADYGLFGMAMVVQGFIGTVYDFGLEDTIVRQRDLTEEQVARLEGLGLFYGIAFALLTVAVAEPVAEFYREPAVEWVLQVLALTTVIEAIQLLPRAT